MNPTVRWMTLCSWLAAAMKCIQSIFLLMSALPFEIADSAEWKAIVDSGSVKVLDSEVANTIRKERPDRVINSRLVRRLKASGGHLPETESQVQTVCFGTPGS